MITSVEGMLSVTGVDWVEITVGGVGLKVFTPPTLLDQVGQVGDRVKLHTSLQVKEDSLTLFGFPSSEARQAFEALLTVNGVGPRVALAVLSRLTAESLALAVATEDATAFKGIPGVGGKIASRIVLELKGKLHIEVSSAPRARPDAELLEALTALGYSSAEVMAAIAALPRDRALTLEEKLRLCLDHMAGG